jgi:hypothetical protein
LRRIKLAVQLDSGTKPSWSTHDSGFTTNIDVEIIASGWGTVSSNRYIKYQDDYNFASVKPAYFVGQLSYSSKAVFYVRGGGKYRFICSWQGASVSLRTAETDYNGQKVTPTTGTPSWINGTKTTVETNIAGSATTLRDKTYGTETYLDYGSSAMTSAPYYGAWDGYCLRAITPNSLATHLATDTLDGRYVNVTGDTMSGLLNAHGGISLNSSTAQSAGLTYILGIKAFAEGGNIVWSSASDVSVGYATNAGYATTADSANTATVAYGVYDYAATSSVIKIGYSGA